MVARMTRIAAVLVLIKACGAAAAAAEADPWKVDFRYAIPWWQTAICLPDDWQKTLVGREGQLLYDYPGKFCDFKTCVTLGTAEPGKWVRQELLSPRVPIVRTITQSGAVEITQEAFAVPAEAAGGAGGSRGPRHDVVVATFRNAGDSPAAVTPVLTIESAAGPTRDAASGEILAGGTRIRATRKIAASEEAKQRLAVRFEPLTLPAKGEEKIAIVFGREAPAGSGPKSVDEALPARRKAEEFWNSGRLPYDRFQIPDPGIQALVESSMRNIYQAREIKKGLPAFQVGPTCYRGLWIVDGAFLLEAATYFGCGQDARPGIQYELTHQRPDGGFTVIKKYWKETGIVLWTVARHARLTGDRQWLESIWPKVQRGVEFIRKLRAEASADPKAPHHGLIPPGFPDGGLGGRHSEFTNVYWTLVGLKAATDAARWLGKTDDAASWQREYDDLDAAFRKAAARDMRTDPHGNRYLPIVMLNKGNELPQRAQWAFCHAVFPGKVFVADDPLVRGNMAMLEATEREGMVYGTGWAADGLWTYFASFYGHAWLWIGEGQKAARSLYAMANHASPLLAWREEQMLQGKGSNKVGDMPHNWASAEFIRLVRHLLVLERGDELHLLEGMPAAWAKPGAVTRLKDMPTEFGPMSLEVAVAADGRAARVRVEKGDSPHLCPAPEGPFRQMGTAPFFRKPAKIVLHVGPWCGGDAKTTLELPTEGVLERTVPIARR